VTEAASLPPGVRKPPRTSAPLLVIVPILAAAGFVIGIAAGVRGDKIAVLALAIATGIVAFVPLAIDQIRPPENRHLLLSLFSMAFLVVFVNPALSIYLPATGPVEPAGMAFTAVDARDIARGQGVALAGLLVFLTAYALPFGRVIGGLFPKPRHDWPPRTTLLVGCLMIPFGWAIQFAGILGLIPERLGSGFIGALSLSTWFGLVLLVLAWFRYRSGLALLLMGVIVPTQMAFFAFSSSKGMILRPPMLIVIALWMYRREITLRWILAGIAAGMLVYPAAQFYRNNVKAGRSMVAMLRNPVESVDEVGRHVSQYTFGQYASEGLARLAHRFDGLGRSSVIIRETPDRVPFQGGWTIAQIPIAYIPRILWPGKPEVGIGQWITDTYGAGAHIRSSTGPSWIGEFYLNFGVPGVVAGMFVMGMLLRVLQEGLLRSATVPAILAGTVVLMNTALEIQGGLVGSVNGVAFTLAPILATHLALRYMGATVPIRSTSPPSAPRASLGAAPIPSDAPPSTGGLPT
jgi:hypothetical protein